MSNKLTDMQLVLLSAASQRDDHCLTLPTGVQRGSARKAAAKLLVLLRHKCWLKFGVLETV